MAYNVVDLVDKAINITVRKKVIYENIGRKKPNIQSIQLMLKVLTKEIDNTIEYYGTLKKEIDGVDFDEIDFGVYDRMSFLINEFNQKKYKTEISNVKEFLKFSLKLEQDTYSLLIDIQGRFVKDTDDIHKKTYKILTDIINNKAEFIKTLEKTIK